MKWPWTKKKTEIDKLMDEAILDMETAKTEGDYEQALQRLERLTKVKGQVEPKKPGVSPDTVVNIVGTGLLTYGVLHFEQVHVVASKMFNPIISRISRRS